MKYSILTIRGCQCQCLAKDHEVESTKLICRISGFNRLDRSNHRVYNCVLERQPWSPTTWKTVVGAKLLIPPMGIEYDIGWEIAYLAKKKCLLERTKLLKTAKEASTTLRSVIWVPQYHCTTVPSCHCTLATAKKMLKNPSYFLQDHAAKGRIISAVAPPVSESMHESVCARPIRIGPAHTESRNVVCTKHAAKCKPAPQ